MNTPFRYGEVRPLLAVNRLVYCRRTGTLTENVTLSVTKGLCIFETKYRDSSLALLTQNDTPELANSSSGAALLAMTHTAEVREMQ